jgi:hypothetical protein
MLTLCSPVFGADGMYKYYTPSPQLCEKRRRAIAEHLQMILRQDGAEREGKENSEVNGETKWREEGDQQRQ